MQLKNKYQKDFKDLKAKGPETIPTHKDLLKDRGMDSTAVISKPEIFTEQKEENKMMQGWKTWLGAFLIVGAVLIQYVFQMPEIGEAVKQLAYLLMGIGIAHKIEKASAK